MDIIFGEVEIYLPESIKSISMARNLLDLLEDEIVSGWVCKHCGCTESSPCPGGCSWVAPNVCSRCIAEGAPEIPESSVTQKQNIIAPPVKVSDTKKPETQGSNTTADSKSSGATVNIIHPEDLKLHSFKHDKNKMQQYKSLFFQELPDGRVVLEYHNAHYYTTKELVLRLPYPFPKRYFKKNGWSSSVKMAFKTYRRYLAETTAKTQTLQSSASGSSSEDLDPDYAFKPFGLNRLTKTSGDGEKIEQEYIDDVARVQQ